LFCWLKPETVLFTFDILNDEFSIQPVFRKYYVWRFRSIQFKERIVFSVMTYCDNNIIAGRSVCNGCQRWLNMKYWYGNERRLRDGLRCRTLEVTSYCHPTATFDIVQILFSVSSRINDRSAAHRKGCLMKHCYKVW
jgi:hypothetical protein